MAGGDAEPALRSARAENKSAEVLQRVQSALEALESKPLSPHLLRETRAVQVLEYQGSTEAQALLRALAQGDPFARLTQDAKAALERLAKRGEDGIP